MNGLGDAVSEKITLGISACLLGEKVRYDGGHKWDPYLTDTLGPYVDWVPVCPEVEVGMGIPREAVRLVGAADHSRLKGIRSGHDWTDAMLAYATRRLDGLVNLDGFIFKSKSPSSGMDRVKIYNNAGQVAAKGPGLFARQFMERFPLIPVEDEGRLHDPVLRENFIERIFAYHRLQQLWHQPFTRGVVVAFHTRQKLLLMSHSPSHYQKLGSLVASVKTHTPQTFQTAYSSLFMEALELKATVKKHTNVLTHMLGYLKKELSADDKASLLAVIDDYHQQLIPLVVPLTLLKHYLQKYEVTYLLDQSYLNPHPKELMLRNHG